MSRFNYYSRLLASLACMLASAQATLAIDIAEFNSKPETCGQHGTSVEFADSLSAAAKQATKEQKLVFVLHVSGLFEKPEYT